MTSFFYEAISITRKLLTAYLVHERQRRKMNRGKKILSTKRDGLPVIPLPVELQGIEPWSKHIRRKLSTCLFMHWL